LHIFTKMKKELYQKIEIPEGVEVNIEGPKITVKGKEGELKKKFNLGKLEFKLEGKEIIIGNKKATKNEKKMMNTIASHVKNLIQGVQKKFEYNLKIVSSHFPMIVDIQKNKAVIKNFLGEKIPREARIPEGVVIESTKDSITIKSMDKELAGQAAANFEKSTRVTSRDRRVFQDGIFITGKAGVEM